MVPLEAPYPGVYIDTFIFFLRSLCKIIWMNVHYFPNAPRICCAFTWPKIHICIKYMYVKANIHLVWVGVYLHMCKLTFTYMQLRSHAQKYTRVQIIHILVCIICIPCVNQRMWTGLNITIDYMALCFSGPTSIVPTWIVNHTNVTTANINKI